MKDPRQAAAAVLEALESTPRHLDALMAQHLDALPQGQARAAAANLVYAVLRERARLDYLLSQYSNKPLAKLDRPVLAILRLGAAELCLLQTPAYAAVDACVKLARAGKAAPAAGLVNAVLRKLAASWQNQPFPPAGAPPARRLSLAYSHPRWLVEELLAQWPAPEVEEWLASRQPKPPLSVRVNTLRASLEEARQALAPCLSGLANHPLSGDCLVLQGAQGPPDGLPGFAQGLWTVQDAGAQALGFLVGARPGMRVLDLCAGAGGKTGHLAAQMENQGELVAVEPSPARALALAGNLSRLGVGNVAVRQEDGLGLAVDKIGRFDRVLVDAPCSGLGVTGRRPDLRWKRRPRHIGEIAALQEKLLAKGWELLAPGGRLIYATCTLTARENQQVAAGLAGPAGAGIEWPPDLAPALAALVGPDGYWRSFPRPQNADGFFAACYIKG